MAQMNALDWEQVSRAIVVHTGMDRFSFPRVDDDGVVAHFGAAAAATLLPVIRELEGDYFSSNAKHVARDGIEMGRLASAEFKARHPEISDEAVEALAWAYTYDNR